ncbi:GldL-related protein [Hymenobacter polaris]
MVGALFKIMHWRFADVMQLTGMLAGLVGVGALVGKIWSKPTA